MHGIVQLTFYMSLDCLVLTLSFHYVTGNVKTMLFFKFWYFSYLKLIIQMMQSRSLEINNALVPPAQLDKP